MKSPSIPMDDAFAERLRSWRVGAKLTQAEAAGKLGIDRAYLSQIEGGRKPGARLRTRFLLEEKAASLKRSTLIVGGLRSLPVLSWAQAGEATEFGEIPADWDDVVPSNTTETFLWAEADRMKGLDITQDNLTNQQGVVKNEVKVNVLNQPYGGFPWLDLPQAANTNWYNAHNFYGDLKEIDAATLTTC